LFEQNFPTFVDNTQFLITLLSKNILLIHTHTHARIAILTIVTSPLHTLSEHEQNFPTFADNPQFLITPLSKSGNPTEKFDVVITLVQDEGTNEEGTLQIAMMMYNNAGKRVSRKDMTTNGFHANSLVKENDDPYSRFGLRDCTMEFSMPMVGSSFTLLPSAFQPGMENDFTLRWFSKKPISVSSM
jgi:hypothetical protein